MIHLDVEYIKLAGGRLEKFSQIAADRWRCRCPICGDSKKDKNKCRGNFFLHGGTYFFKCFNCNASFNIFSFLQKVFPDLYQDYLSAKTGATISSLDRKQKPVEEEKPKPEFTQRGKHLKDLNLPSLADLPADHPAVTYIQARKIPAKYIHDLFYASEFKRWANGLVAGTFKSLDFDEPRIVIPFRDTQGGIFAFQGRSLEKSKLKYLTVKVNKDSQKVYGLDRVDFSKDVYVVEGPFDSLFLENCLASADGGLSLDGPFVFIWDNEPRNEHIVKQMLEAIQTKKKVVVWPQDAHFNDINDAVQNFGISVEEINQMVKARTFYNLDALVELNNWKKI